jgi:hypothetical protein
VIGRFFLSGTPVSIGLTALISTDTPAAQELRRREAEVLAIGPPAHMWEVDLQGSVIAGISVVRQRGLGIKGFQLAKVKPL